MKRVFLLFVYGLFSCKHYMDIRGKKIKQADYSPVYLHRVAIVKHL